VRGAVVCTAAIIVLAAGAAKGQTQLDLNARAAADLRKSDEQLNAVYSKLRGKVSDAGKKSLQTAQRSWLRFRDEECEFETMGTVGGTIHSMIVAICLTRLTDQRIKDLEAQLHCKEGDLSCGGQ